VQYYITAPPADLRRCASGDFYSGGDPVTEEECRVALSSCLAKGWLRVVDEAALREITDELREGGVLGPVYGLPQVGGVDLTRRAASLLWPRVQDKQRPDRRTPAFAYTDVVHRKTAHYFRTRAAAHAEMEVIRGNWSDIIETFTGPVPTGPWRVQWWRRLPQGYRIDVEERMHWRGFAGFSAEPYLNRPVRKRPMSRRLQDSLNRHNVNLGEWLILSGLDRDAAASPGSLPREVVENAREVFGITTSEPECRAALYSCLRNHWVWVIDEAAANRVFSLLGQDAAIKPLLQPPGLPLGAVDLTPGGAALYQMVAAECFGPDWDAEVSVSRDYYIKVHFYCETEEGLQARLQSLPRGGVPVLSTSPIVPLGPWCVAWWQRYPSGYMVEVEIGDPSGEDRASFYT
jgi:hypothetical protein